MDNVFYQNNNPSDIFLAFTYRWYVWLCIMSSVSCDCSNKTDFTINLKIFNYSNIIFMFATTENFMDFLFISLECVYSDLKEKIIHVLGYQCHWLFVCPPLTVSPNISLHNIPLTVFMTLCIVITLKIKFVDKILNINMWTMYIIGIIIIQVFS